MISSFGSHTLQRFEVITEEVQETPMPLRRPMPAQFDAHPAAA
jgi:hypothetical protein